MKRSIAFVLALILLSVSLFSCSPKKEYTPVITYGTQSISVNIFTFLLSQAKTMSLLTLGQTSDNAEFWDTESGVFLSDFIMEDTLSTAMSMAYYADAAVMAGAQLTSEEKDAIKASLDEMVSSKGSKQNFNIYMSEFGVDYDILTEYYYLQSLATKGKDIVLGEGGAFPVTDADCRKYYEENYVTMRHFNLNNINKIGANGKAVALTESEKADVDARANEIYDMLSQGHDMAEFAAESTDEFLTYYPMGFTFPTTDMLHSLASAVEESGKFNVFGLYYYLLNNVEGFADAAFSDEVSTVSRFENDKGIFFTQKLPLDAEMYEYYKPLIYDSGVLEPQKTKELMELKKSEFIIDTATLDTFSVKGASIITE